LAVIAYFIPFPKEFQNRRNSKILGRLLKFIRAESGIIFPGARQICVMSPLKWLRLPHKTKTNTICWIPDTKGIIPVSGGRFSIGKMKAFNRPRQRLFWEKQKGCQPMAPFLL
jgi:hypothetical protein